MVVLCCQEVTPDSTVNPIFVACPFMGVFTPIPKFWCGGLKSADESASYQQL